MELAARLYKVALTPLKLTVRERARERSVVKFRIQGTRHIVLNQHMLSPVNKHSTNTCNGVFHI